MHYIMMPDANPLIDKLVGDLKAVRPLRHTQGFAVTMASAGFGLFAMIGMFGIRSDLSAGQFEPSHMIATGLFLLLAIASTASVVTMSHPRVGAVHNGWIWPAAMVALLPIAGLLFAFSQGGDLLAHESLAHGIVCFAIVGSTAVMVMASLIWWLRRGAPTSPERAGLLSGLAAGSFGIFTFSLYCPENDIVHIWLWHTGALFLAAAVGRLIVPSLVRW
jgi:hypothetical protein